MKDKYCLPVIKTNESDVLATIEKHKSDYGYFEVWLDYIDDLNLDFVSGLVDKYPDRIIFVFRRQNLEPAKMPSEQRKKVLDLATGKNCLVDLDIAAQSEDLDYLKASNKDKNLLCSYHDYSQTPPDDQLEEIVDKMESYSPGIIKISTMCNSPNDALRLLRLQQKLSDDNKRHIVIGMGENGLITRIFGTLWGNELAFVPETVGEKSAPGQISREKFDRIIKDLTD